MYEYIEFSEVLSLANKALECTFKQVSRKTIIYQGAQQNGETITLCSPRSKIHPQGFYWVDITQEQARVLNETDKGIILFRLEGQKLLVVKWSELKLYLTADCIRYNSKEKKHWKLNIYNDHIKISGNAKEMPAKIYHFTQ